MRLSDIMSSLDLAVYPVVAMIIFTGVFLLMTGRLLRAERAGLSRCARLPLDDDRTLSDSVGAGQEKAP